MSSSTRKPKAIKKIEQAVEDIDLGLSFGGYSGSQREKMLAPIRKALGLSEPVIIYTGIDNPQLKKLVKESKAT